MSATVCSGCGRATGEPYVDDKGRDRIIDLRPYGPGGALVCFPCGTATPEAEARARGAFLALLDGSEAISPTGLVAIGEPGGPRPFDPQEPAAPPSPGDGEPTDNRVCDSCGQGDGARLTFSPEHYAWFCARCYARENPTERTVT